MYDKQRILSEISKTKIVPVIKIDDVADTRPLLRALSAGGINIAEITYRTACAPDAISLALKEFPQMIIGAGTVINLVQAEQAAALGAHFIVSPGFDESIAGFCNSKGIIYFGGCVTPTEIMKAVSMGQEIIKFFPSESFGGLKTIKALAAPFPQIKFMPTGGINKDNIREYLSCNKIIACGGSWMVKDELIKSGDFAAVTRLTAEALLEVNR
ncbi:MAG: bifunctional 4-hydroxy-2-oxoglutarate aldolase/2-dehydro-3-deoxy-phosphogluconate aldolase [Clostridia bacterium]|nr:bifunctional 4-hydroxy-2-oxoglutarate aldolase/2-dehydro-3-deoxy-phosphogluconate aldolase [Clostridia bacterium]